jgi:hypothetical protein
VVGSPVNRSEVFEVFSFTPKIENQKLNGSFEVGIGGSNYFPGYRVNYKPYLTEYIEAIKTPAKIYLDSTEKRTGKVSLCIDCNSAIQEQVFYITPPNFLKNPLNKTQYISFYVKASKKKITQTIQLYGLKNKPKNKFTKNIKLTDEWQKVTLVLESNENDFAPGITLISKSDTKGAYKIWYDDFVWSFDKESEYKSPIAEIVLQPISKNAVIFPNMQVKLNWKMKSQNKDVETELYIRDVIHNGKTVKVFSKKTLPSNDLIEGSFTLNKKLNPGLYITAIVVRDRATRKILAQDKQLFSVLTNLQKLPPFIGFSSGSMYAFEEPFAYTYYGISSLEEQFLINKLSGTPLIRDLHTWTKFEPNYNRFDWDIFDLKLGFATKYGCSFMYELPELPIKVPRGTIARLKKFPKQTKPFNWILKYGKIQGLKKELLVDNIISKDEYVNLDGKETFWFTDKEKMKNVCRTFLNKYKDKGIKAIEFKNEVNAMVPAKFNIDNYMKPTYPVMKEIVPNTPIMVNNTGGAGLSYFKEIIANGGQKYLDGISFHPYAHSTLKSGSLKDVRMYRNFLDKISPNRHLTLAQTEALSLRDPYDIVQRILSDWVGGCEMSAGVPWRALYSKLHSSKNYWRNTGPLVPSMAAVMLNGMHKVLAGMKLINSAKTPNDILIGLFENNEGTKEYAAVLCCADNPDSAVLLKGLSEGSLELEFYDETGSKIIRTKNDSIFITASPLYIKSRDRKLIEKLIKPEYEYINFAQYKKKITSINKTLGVAHQIIFGGEPREITCTIKNYKIEQVSKITADHNIITNKVTLQPSQENLILKGLDKNKYTHLASDVYSQNKTMLFNFSGIGVENITIFLNGEKVLNTKEINAKQELGETWLSQEVRMKDGKNRFDIFIKPSLEQVALRTKLTLPEELKLGNFLSSYQLYKDRMISPGVTISFDNMKLQDGYKIYQLVDFEDENVGFRVDNRKLNSAFIFEFDDKRPYKINSYLINPRFARVASNWKFQGSNDKKSWVTLHKENGYTFKKHKQYIAEFNNQTAYKYYRLLLESNKPTFLYKEIRLFTKN